MSAVYSQSKFFPQLQFTDNNLQDVINMIIDNNIVALYTTEACRVFHNLDVLNLYGRRVVYINCNSLPCLLDNGEWERFIHDAIPSVQELDAHSILRGKIIDQREVPNRAYVRLGF